METDVGCTNSVVASETRPTLHPPHPGIASVGP